MQQLYEGSSWGVSLLPELLRIPAPWMAVGVVVMAGLAFAGAEKVERRFRDASDVPDPDHTAPVAASRRRPSPRTLAPRWGLVGVLAAVAFTSGFMGSPVSTAMPAAQRSLVLLQPLELAEILVAGQTTQLLLDLDSGAGARSSKIPGAVSGADAAAVLSLLESLPEAWTVIVFDANGQLASLPPEWPPHLDYRVLDGGFAAWEREVLTPQALAEAAPMERDGVRRQNALAAYFSGAQLEAVNTPPPPPPVPTSKAKDKKKPGGC